jgi:phosphoribosylanthranilate isomerase
MKTPTIKVCGVTDLHQAFIMEAWGVGYLGFNFVEKSKRYISPEDAFEITSEMKTTTLCTGVFQNHSKEQINQTIEAAGLDCIQLHGDETPEFCAQFDLPVIKVFHMDENFEAKQLEDYVSSCEIFLFDSKVKGRAGGTGQTFDWATLDNIDRKRPFWLAGGLGIDNIKEAISVFKPNGVDLNSKIETAPGDKDLKLLEKCLALIEA